MPNRRVQEAIALMEDFAHRTGLTSPHPSRRYLWTVAFAVCSYLGLGRSTGDERYTGLALHLVDQVHDILGRHRDDDPRSGWISVFGSPTYFVDGDMFYGQDRLELVARALERPFANTWPPIRS